MRKDYIVICLLIGLSILSLLIFIRKRNIKSAFLAILVYQTFTWPAGLLLTYLHMLEYPVRLFPKAIDSSFLNGFIINPSIFCIYYIHYPKKSKLAWRFLYTLLILTIPITIEFLNNKYTNLVKYKSWNWYFSLPLLLATYFISTKYSDWFIKNTRKGA